MKDAGGCPSVQPLSKCPNSAVLKYEQHISDPTNHYALQKEYCIKISNKL